MSDGLNPRLSGEQTCGDASCTLASSCCLSPLPHQIRPLCFSERPWRTLKSADFQSLKTEANTKQSHQSERSADRESGGGRESLIRKEQDIRVGNKKNKNGWQTATHSHTHAHAHARTSRSADWPTLLGWRTALREPWLSELDKRE